MHDEALVTLPDVLSTLHVRQPIFIGHSDGGSIAIIYAGASAGPLLALILEAPHVFVEDLSVESITRIKTTYQTTDLAARLARHHGDNTDAMFRGWNDIWLSPEFRDWNIEACLPSIRCPILVIQGEGDEYGTMRQVDAIEAGAAGPVEAVRLAACGHAPHVDQREQALDAMTRFIAERRAPEERAARP
jgi:pimeloyl-ACP methyl ester carboxylesterase